MYIVQGSHMTMSNWLCGWQLATRTTDNKAVSALARFPPWLKGQTASLRMRQHQGRLGYLTAEEEEQDDAFPERYDLADMQVRHEQGA